MRVKNLNVLGHAAIPTLAGSGLSGNGLGDAGTDNDNNRIEKWQRARRETVNLRAAHLLFASTQARSAINETRFRTT
jgi:hypothetical protein